ncbi:MAG: DUF4209 domain-containing protein [Paludibacter sp.]|nr:DUF4209 domain-containing protein [Paludibacter sp.]
MEKLKTVIDEYNKPDKKRFDEHAFASALRALFPPRESGEEIPFELKAESIAFDLVEDYRSDNYSWGTYFGPMWVSSDGKGNVTEAPSIQFITKEVLEYWEKRIDETVNPILKARYAGLVWDFKEKQTGEKPNFEICKKYINALIEIGKGDYHGVEIYTYTKLKQALKWAIASKDTGLINDAKNTLIVYEKANAKDTLPGTWGQSMKWLMKNPKIFTADEELGIVTDLQERLERLKAMDIDGVDKEKFDPWSIEHNALLLADYFNKKGDKVKEKEYLDEIRDSINKVLPSAAAMQKTAWLEKIYQLYVKHQFKEDAEEILKEITKYGEATVDEMGQVAVPFEIPKDKLNEYLEEMTIGGFEDVILRFVSQYIPNKEDNKKQLLESAKNAPLQFLFTTSIVDEKGRVLAKVGGIEKDLEGQLLLHISNSLQMSSFFIRHLLMKMDEKGLLSKDSILEFLKKSPVFDEKRYVFIEKGLDAFFANDYITAIHLLIPQIENVVRTIIEKTGGLTLKPSRNGGFHLKTFDELLRDEELNKALGEDFTNYLRILFTEQRGWNLRNDVCHGIASPGHFNYASSDRVLHALLCLGFIKFEDK